MNRLVLFPIIDFSVFWIMDLLCDNGIYKLWSYDCNQNIDDKCKHDTRLILLRVEFLIN